MRRRVIVSIVAAAAILATGVLTTADTTLARYTDVEAKPGQLGAATVVLGAASRTPTLSFANPSASGTVTATLTVVYAGTTTARITLNAKPATTYASNFCTYSSGTGWTTRSILGAVGPSITFGIAGTSIGYCALLNGAEVTLAPSVAAGSSTSYPISATYSGLLNGLFSGKTDSVPLSLHAYSTQGSGFNHTTTGTLTVSTSASVTTSPRSLAAARSATAETGTTVAPTSPTTSAAPTPAPTGTTVTAADVPAECAAAGMSAGSFTEKITLTAARPGFDAARDRPGVAGPFLVVGSAAADTIVGSAGADCLTGGDGDDVVSGGAGADVLVGGAGADRLAGEADADRLAGGAGIDVLDGGPGADLVDGGPDGARCTTDAEDTAVGCLAAEGAPADPAPAPAVAPTTAQAPSTPNPSVPTPSAPNPSAPTAEGGADSPAPADSPAGAPTAVPEGVADPTAATPAP